MKASDWDAIAADYHSEIISPLRESVHNPLLDELDQSDFSRSRALELGCGTGELLPELAVRFDSVLGIDFSTQMIEAARVRMQGLPNVELAVADMQRMKRELGPFDAVVSVNSLLAPSSRSINAILRRVFRALRPGGRFFGILPAMESYIYQHMIGADRGRANRPDNGLDLFRGIIDFEGAKQKAFYRFELWYRFGKAGFSNFRIDKVAYSWKAWRDAGQAYYASEHPPWDWFLSCEKPL